MSHGAPPCNSDIFEIKKSVRYSCCNNWNRLNVIYSSYQLIDYTETALDSKTSWNITYSALLRDAKIEITGIAHFYSWYLCIKSCPKEYDSYVTRIELKKLICPQQVISPWHHYLARNT